MFEPAANMTSTAPLRVLESADLPQHAGRLYRAAYALCRSREDAEDLVQETYARVLRRPRLLQCEEDLAYLLRVLRNTWISSYRTAQARPSREEAAEIKRLANPLADAGELAVEVQAIYGAIRTLPEPLRETIAAVDIAGLSYREAARALQTKPGTIMSRLYRARERVAEHVHRTSGVGS
jgi:RNA polymerase sigma-70 factor (ECF subfamily)